MTGQPGRRKSAVWAAMSSAAVLLGTVACGGSNAPQSGPNGTSGSGTAPKLAVVSTINAWGSIAAQLGGDRVQQTSIITNPDTDPHSYEPSTGDARTVANAKIVVENGIGYDAWADKMVASNPNPQRTVVNVGDTVGVADGGNPHQWYSPDSVTKVANAITAAYKKADPTDSGYFDQQNQQFLNQSLSSYHSSIANIKAKYAGTPVGASESIFSPLSDALGLNLITPPGIPQGNQRRHRSIVGGQGDHRPPDLHQGDQGLRVQQPKQHPRCADPGRRGQTARHTNHDCDRDPVAGKRVVSGLAIRAVV